MERLRVTVVRPNNEQDDLLLPAACPISEFISHLLDLFDPQALSGIFRDPALWRLVVEDTKVRLSPMQSLLDASLFDGCILRLQFLSDWIQQQEAENLTLS